VSRTAPARVRVLAYLRAVGREFTVVRARRELLMSNQTIHAAIGALVREGLVRKLSKPYDPCVVEAVPE
jgi:predicted DNA-binding transcriptional regulator